MHKKRKIGFIFLIGFSISIGNAYAIDGISIGYGHGVAGLKPLRIGVQKTWQQPWLQKTSWVGKGYWEFSAYHMRRSNQDEQHTNNKIAAIALAPVFRLYNTTPILYDKNLYVEFAIGVAQMNKRTIGKRELGINFQFEDRIGLGVQFGNNNKYDVGYRVIHFSNAYLGHKNHGINIHMLYINYWLN